MKQRATQLKEAVAKRWRQFVRGEQGNAPVLRRFAKNFSLSAGGSVASMLIGLGRTALLTKTLAVASFGKVLIVTDLFNFVMLFLDVRVHDVLYRFYPQFEEEGNREALRGLLLGGLLICLGLGLLVGGGMLLVAPWMASFFYDDPALASLFRVYAGAVVFSAFTGFYTPILRIHDRFSSIIIPQVLGNAVTLCALLVYILGLGGRALDVIVMAFAAGLVLQAVPPLVMALRLTAPYLRRPSGGRGAWQALAPYKRELKSTLYQTNIAGYLKLGSEQGGAFLLGVLSTPEQVALYGIARQFSKPLAMLQGNIQTAITPEVFTLYAKDKKRQLYALVKRFVTGKLVLGGLALGAAFLLARPLILLIAKPEYLAAIPVFYVFVTTVYVTFVALTFYPLTVAMGRLKRRNLFVAARFVYLGVAAALGLDALRLSAAQLAGSLTTRLGADLFVFGALRDAAGEEEGSSDEGNTPQNVKDELIAQETSS